MNERQNSYMFEGVLKIRSRPNGEKSYYAILTRGMPRRSRYSRRSFKRARDAADYGIKIVARYSKLLYKAQEDKCTHEVTNDQS